MRAVGPVLDETVIEKIMEKVLADAVRETKD